MLKRVLLEGIWGFAWSYQDEKDLPITAPFFADAREFSEGMAAVKFVSSWGYINVRGEVVIPPMFDDASSFCEGLARVRIGSKYGFINQVGEFSVVPQFIWASDFVDGLAKIKIRSCGIDGIYRNYDAFINKHGQVLNRFFDAIKENTDNSVILYQQTNNEIAFSVDHESCTEIVDWGKGISLSHHQIRMLQVECELIFYCLNLQFVENQADLKITRNTVEQAAPTQFSKTFNKQSSSDLVYSKAIDNFPPDVNRFQQLVLKIEGEFYQHLVNWENWVSVEAFTGRYIYKFFNNPNDNKPVHVGIYVHILDLITHTELHLDYSWRFDPYDRYFEYDRYY